MTERVEEREKISLFQKRILSILNSKSENKIWFPYTLPYIWMFLQHPLQGRAVSYCFTPKWIPEYWWQYSKNGNGLLYFCIFLYFQLKYSIFSFLPLEVNEVDIRSKHFPFCLKHFSLFALLKISKFFKESLNRNRKYKALNTSSNINVKKKAMCLGDP